MKFGDFRRYFRQDLAEEEEDECVTATHNTHIHAAPAVPAAAAAARLLRVCFCASACARLSAFLLRPALCPYNKPALFLTPVVLAPAQGGGAEAPVEPLRAGLGGRHPPPDILQLQDRGLPLRLHGRAQPAPKPRTLKPQPGARTSKPPTARTNKRHVRAVKGLQG